MIEYLQTLCDLRQSAQIQYRAENGGLANLQARIRQVELDAALPRIELDNGLWLELSRVLRVNGRDTTLFA